MEPPIEITLKEGELAIAGYIGCLRQIKQIGRPNAHELDDLTGWPWHIEGACREMAVAKALDRYWEPRVNTFKAADIGGDIQVRGRTLDSYELFIRPGENRDHLWVLVTGVAPAFKVWGYRLGHDIVKCGRSETYGGRPPAWFLSTDQLWPLKDLQRCE